MAVIFHDSRDKRYRDPAGVAAASSAVSLSLYAEGAAGAVLRLWRDYIGEELVPMEPDGEGIFSARIELPAEPGIVWYYFIVSYPDGRSVFYGNAPDGLGGEGAASDSEPRSFQITVYEPYSVPEWYLNSVVYQIFPDRFRRGRDSAARRRLLAIERRRGPKRRPVRVWNSWPDYDRDANGEMLSWGFFGGTLEGVREKLGYLQSLGIGAIYLNPIFEAASNHRYDTADYMKIDPLLGDEESFRRLCSEARRRGIRIILDGVFSHTGADSIYFDKYGNYGGKGACRPVAAAGGYGSETAEGAAPGSGTAAGEEDAPAKSALWASERPVGDPESPYYKWFDFDGSEAGYRAWWGVKDLPEVNELEPSFTEFICGENGVIAKWLRAGASGFRLDVADELPDAFIRAVRDRVKAEDPDALLIGEVWEDASNKESYGEKRRFLMGRELDSVMNYPFREALIGFAMGTLGSEGLGRRLLSLAENYPPGALYGALDLLDSHDRCRILTVLGGAEDVPKDRQSGYALSPEARKSAVRKLMMLSLLQYALPGVPCLYYGDEAGLEGHTDPYNRRTYPWGSEDRRLLEHYRSLGRLYTAHSALKGGSFEPVRTGSEDVFAFVRDDGRERLLVAANRGEEPARLSFEGETLELEPVSAAWRKLKR
jgi:4-alpha-glucanotransferase